MPVTKDPAGLQLISPVLTNLALNYRFEGGIYDQVVSKMAVAYNAGQYPEWSRADFMRADVDNEVSDRAPTPEIDASYTLRDYQLKNYRLKVSVTPEERGQAHPALRFEQTKVALLMDAMAIRRERRLAIELRHVANGGQITNGGNPAIRWDQANATIEKDIKASRKAVYDATGQHVDTMILSWDVAYAIALDPAIREIIKYTIPGNMIISQGEAILPRNLHGLRVVIAGQDKFNAGPEGGAENLQGIWGDNVRFVKTAGDNQWGKPATVYSLRGRVLDTEQSAARRGGGAGGGVTGGAWLVDRWAEADPPVDYIRAWEKVAEKVVAPDIAYELADVLT